MLLRTKEVATTHLYYVDNWSLTSDVVILLRTIRAVDLSIASYYFVEEPLRTGGFSGHKHLGRRAVAGFSCCAVALVAYAVRPAAPLPNFEQAMNGPQSVASATNVVAPLRAVQTALRQSLQLTSWPTLSNQATVNRGFNTDICAITGSMRRTFESTVHTGVTRTVVLVGDSVMINWLSMMKAVFLPNGWRVIQLANYDSFGADVPYADTLQGNGGALTQNSTCDRQHAYVRSVLTSLHPNLVLIEDMSDAIDQVSDGHGKLLPHDQQVAQYQAGLAKTIELAKSAGAISVVLSATPNHPDWAACRVADSTPLSCIGPPEPNWYEIQKYDLAVTNKLGVPYLDTLPLWCVSGVCPDVVNSTGTIVNNHHITQEYGEYVAPSLAEAFKRLKLL